MGGNTSTHGENAFSQPIYAMVDAEQKRELTTFLRELEGLKSTVLRQDSIGSTPISFIALTWIAPGKLPYMCPCFIWTRKRVNLPGFVKRWQKMKGRVCLSQRMES